MRLPTSAHTSRPWRIHEVAPDFRVEDVWALPTPGGPDDHDRLVRRFAAPPVGDRRLPGPVRVLMDLRWKIGGLLGWDGDGDGVGGRVPTLRDRLPDDLRDGERGPDLPTLPFTSVFQTHDEWAAEYANKTMHGILHIGWVPDGHGGYRGQMAVLVKPNGLFGRAYMAAIVPFRHLLVYPLLIRSIGREWRMDSEAAKTP